jgi:dTDP-4-dehydrorhamnose 3,5-epimerase
MNFEVESTPIEGVKVIKTKRFADERGFFTETYRAQAFKELGIPEFVQDNLSESKKGVVRGLHWQETPHGQGKLVSCLKGRIIDIAVDIRMSSPTFGQHFAIELSSDNGLMLWIPGELAHGFESLVDETRVNYKVTEYWNIKAERSLTPLDPRIAISWSTKSPILSEKDIGAMSFSEFCSSSRE